jgi:hypothetical protein
MRRALPQSVIQPRLFITFFRACVRNPLDFSGFKMYIIQLMHFFIQEINDEQPKQHERGG